MPNENDAPRSRFASRELMKQRIRAVAAGADLVKDAADRIGPVFIDVIEAWRERYPDDANRVHEAIHGIGAAIIEALPGLQSALLSGAYATDAPPRCDEGQDAGRPVVDLQSYLRTAEPYIGSDVFYVLRDRNGRTVSRPAKVTQVWGSGVVNLTVFPDGLNDLEDGAATLRVYSAPHGEPGVLASWHFRDQVERAPAPSNPLDDLAEQFKPQDGPAGHAD